MFETAIALYAAHVMADFVFQTDWMVRHKARLPILLLHVLIVVLVTALIAGTLAPLPLLMVAILHFCIDFWKQRWGGNTLGAFATDQLAHFASVLSVAWLLPATFNAPFWNQVLAWTGAGGVSANNYLWLLALVSGFIMCVRAGGFGVDMFIKRFDYRPSADDPGLAEGGFYIGLLERTMIFLLVIANQIAGIGFLVAAKSILRFGATQDRKTGEYVIVGTLASFIWALFAAFITQAVMARLG